MSPEFSISVRDLPDCHVVALQGALDIATAEGLAWLLVEAAVSTLVVDLSDLSLIDSRGITALVEARERVVAAGAGDVVLTRPRGIVRTALEIAGLDEWIVEWSPEWDN